MWSIESADDAPEVFTEELGELLSLVAQNIEVRVSMASPVKFMAAGSKNSADL